MISQIDYSQRLQQILDEFGCQTGTLHRADADRTNLLLVCQIGVPDMLLEKISEIPFGKGIAGAAADRREPVELCNIQQDLGGIANPDARKTGVSGSLAVPIFSDDRSQVIGTLGIGKFVPHAFTDGEKLRLTDHAAELARYL